MRLTPFVLAALAATPLAARAADSRDAQIAALESRIHALEANAQSLQQQASDALAAAKAAQAELQQMKAAQSSPVAAASAPAASAAPSAGSAANAFNPAISLILNGLYEHHSLASDDYRRAGFPLVGEAGPGPQGLHLGESELSFAASIDDKFYGQLTLTMDSAGGETHTGIEEAYIDTTALPDGFTLRAGRFYSNVGYLNSHHTHTDFFSDRPLAYQAFLGNQYGDDGVQARWVAPTDTYLEIGGEVFRGDNFPAGGAANAGSGVKTLFLHAGGDIGVEQAWLAGVSLLRADARGAEDGFSGRDNLYLADLTWKWAPRGAFKDAGVVLRSELFLDDRKGTVTDLADPAQPAVGWDGQRRGAYLEGLYRFSRQWDAGYRYDRLWAPSSGPYASEHDPQRHTAMLTWHNSEFSLFRLQYSHDAPQAHFIDHALMLQYQVSLGAHGAHKF